MVSCPKIQDMRLEEKKLEDFLCKRWQSWVSKGLSILKRCEDLEFVGKLKSWSKNCKKLKAPKTREK